MDEKTTTEQSTMVSPAEKSIPASSEIIATEHRTAYGTAKTENLRDSGIWRYILPAFVILLCLAILAVPLLILIPLFVNSLDVTSHTHNLTWLWLTMIVLEVGIAALVIYGLLKIFLTQAGNYQS
jgi:type II secretory pathway component PulF